ncbi:uncharacterized protein LOC127761299 isoform X1 [Oryza glaberrima]|uniref:uncharacterized protein LOC127761299 isoform X1 n=1 Tax=Oryza glaberrima TaxID=4538 RepID=UPI00224BF0EB|nr:uncharacterized protein LOC127761299 isoform X1 [Oryza glaberrima]XP_052141531.1 uncharacterized protein LOC127761299 isoform X1 [Oryza glaberrima]
MLNQVRSTAMPCGIRVPLLSWFGDVQGKWKWYRYFILSYEDIDITTTWTGKSYEASCCWCKWTCNQIKCPVMRRKRWPGQPRSRPMCLQSAAKWKLEQPDVSESMHCLNHELASPSLIRSLPST